MFLLWNNQRKLSKFAVILESKQNIEQPINLPMNSMLRFIVIGCVIFMTTMSYLAYSQDTKKVDQKKVTKLLKEADYLFQAREAKLAEQKYREVLKYDPSNYKAVRRVGRCNFFLGNMEEAINWYQSALDIDPKYNDTTWFDLGVALKMLERYGEAKNAFTSFLKYHTTKDYIRTHAETEIKGCEFAEKYKPEDNVWTVTKLGFNSKNGDFNPWLYEIKGDSFIIFTSHRKGARGKLAFAENGEEHRSDIWIVQMDNDTTYGTPENLGKKVNTKVNDGSLCVTSDGLTMYYTICGRGKSKKYHGCSIYESQFNPDAKTWGKFRKVEGLQGKREVVVNSRGKTKKVDTYDAQPCVSEDGNTMYFSSDRDGGQGETDLWYSKKQGQGWTTPVNCGPSVNTEFHEIFPFIAKDSKTLYFASNGHLGFGGYDLFKTQGAGSSWSQPENLGKEINGSYDDFACYWLTPDTVALFSSNRPGGEGSDDIYLARRIVRPVIELSVHGTVRDKKTKQPIPFATVTLYKKKDGVLIPVDTFRTDQTAGYRFPLEKDFDYKLVGNAPEYLANEVFVSTIGVKKSTDLEADIDIYLERIVIDQPIVLQNIYYDFDKADLRPESIEELNKLVKILNDNPTISIQLGSHTDTNGSEQYNIKLSQRRADSVVKFLIAAGIAKDRLTSFGFGESEPLIYPELSDADEQANRRTEFRIKSMNYTPKAASNKSK